MSDQDNIQERLKRINNMICHLVNRFHYKKSSPESTDPFFLEYLDCLVELESLVNQTYAYSLIQDPEKRDKFYEDSRTLRTHAKLLATHNLNKDWMDKHFRLMQGSLKNVMEIKDDDCEHLYEKLHLTKVCLRVAEHILTYDKEDLFNLEECHPKWHYVNTHIERVKLAEPEVIAAAVDKFNKWLTKAGGVAYYTFFAGSSFTRNLMSMWTRIKMTFQPKLAFKANTLFKNTMCVDKARLFIGGVQMGWLNLVMHMIYPWIKYCRVIYITPAHLSINEQNVMNWLKDKTDKIILDSPKTVDSKEAENIDKRTEIKIPIRINSPVDIDRKKPYTGDQPDDFETIIYHIHGGGWITMSPKSHQMYTRQWSKLTGAPIFSVDYRKAPQNPFPAAIDDCWQVYHWLLEESHKYFKVRKNKRIIICGDSAGGNLSLALTNLIVEQGAPLPYYLVTFYPALTSKFQRFTPSHLHTLNDPMISYEFGQLVSKAYVSKEEFHSENNYFVNPLYTPENVLKKYPPSHMYIGDNDPLHDDAVRYAYRMKQSETKSPFKLTVYLGIMHGFLSVDVPVHGIKEAKQCILDSAQLFSEIIAKR